MYSRREVTDHVTVMTKELYDNLQDGIDESKQAISELEESLAETKQDFSSQIQQGMGGIRYDPSRDMIIVQNPYTGKWIDWQETGKLVKPSTITITTETLKGQQVTLTIGVETYTSFFDQSDGTAMFTVYSDGEATVTCGDYSMTITIDEKGGVTTSGSLEIFNGYRLIHNGILCYDTNSNFDLVFEGAECNANTKNGRFYVRSIVNDTSLKNATMKFSVSDTGQFTNSVIGIKGKYGILGLHFRNNSSNMVASYTIDKDREDSLGSNVSGGSSPSEVPLREFPIQFANWDKSNIVQIDFNFRCLYNAYEYYIDELYIRQL